MAEEIVKTKKSSIQNFNLSNSADTLSLATDLAKFIKENKLYQNIQGKEFVNVEGWQYAGARLGIVPIADEPQNISTADEIRYKCSVKLYSLTSDQIVGSGFAMCSNKEQGKRYFQEFAIASMCQTRAIGKAYRNMLAWIIRAAGYEPTPAEEMDSNEPGTGIVEQPKQAQQQQQEQKQPVTPLTPESAPDPVKMATPKQKYDIETLLKNEHITREEKAKILLNINKFTFDTAEQKIVSIQDAIKKRENEAVKQS